MRRRAAVVAAGACLLSLLNPSPAFAIFGGGWLERLSGPGPFSGLFVNARLVCLSGPTSDSADAKALDDDRSAGRRLTFPRERNARIWLTGAGCHFLPVDQPRMEIGIDLGFLNSSDNLLDYRDDDLTEGQKQVRLRTFMITADLRVNRVIDVGAGIGRAWFNSPSGLFTDFPRTVTQPIRLTTRPLATFWNDHRAAGLIVLFDGTRFHGGFRAEDFGAREGTYSEPTEMVWAWSIRVDPLVLLWRTR